MVQFLNLPMFMSKVESGLKPDALSGRSVEVAIDYLPEAAIKMSVVNSRAKEFLDPENWYLASDVFLRKLAAMTVPLTQSEDTYSTAQEEGRTLPLIKLDTPIKYSNGILGKYISAKGVNVSGEKYKNLIKGLTRTTVAPWGFFGDSDAAHDLNMSNLFLENNGRGSLAIGYLILSTQEVRKFLATNWWNYETQQMQVKESLSRFHTWSNCRDSINGNINRITKSGNDLMAIHFRLHSGRHRLASFEKPMYEHYTDEGSLENIATTSFLLSQEVDTNTNFRTYLRNSGTKRHEARRIFEQIADDPRRKLRSDDQVKLKSLIRSITIEQAAALAKTCVALGYSTPALNYIVFSASKDIDSGLMLYDFEADGKTMLPCDSNRHQIGQRLENWAEKVYSDYTKGLCLAGCLNKSSKTQSGKEFHMLRKKLKNKMYKLKLRHFISD